MQLPVNHATASLESALSGFHRTVNAFRTFDCDCLLYALELVAVRTADVFEKSYKARMPAADRNSLGVRRLRMTQVTTPIINSTRRGRPRTETAKAKTTPCSISFPALARSNRFLARRKLHSFVPEGPRATPRCPSLLIELDMPGVKVGAEFGGIGNSKEAIKTAPTNSHSVWSVALPV